MTPAEFRGLFPEFARETDERLTAVIASADSYFDATRWDDLYSAGLGNWVAHKLATQNGGQLGKDATITSKSVGALSVSRDVNLTAHDPFLSTLYGREYRRLANLVGMGGGVV